MAKQQTIDLKNTSTLDLQKYFLQEAANAYNAKSEPQKYQDLCNSAKALWNEIKTREDVNPNLRSQDGQGMAHWSLELNDAGLTKEIHELGKQASGNHGLSFYYKDATGRTTCFWSAAYDNKDLVKYCVENGAKINLIDTSGYNLKGIISNKGWTDILDLAAVNDKVWGELLGMVGISLDNKLIFQKDKEQTTAANIVKVKNSNLTNTEMPDDYAVLDLAPSKNMLPYYFACHIGSGFIAHKILEGFKVSPNHQDSNGWGHYHWVINLPESKGKPIQMDMLKKAGCNVNMADKAGNTPLHWTDYLSEATATKLLMLGADINAVNGQGFTPITIACLESLKYRFGNAPDLAAAAKAANIACYILNVSLNNPNINIDFTICDKTLQQAPLGHWLLEAHNNDASKNWVFPKIFAKGYNVNLVDGNGKSVMDWAVQYKWKNAVKTLHDECYVAITDKQKALVANDADFSSFLNQLDNPIVDQFAALHVGGDVDTTVGLYY